MSPILDFIRALWPIAVTLLPIITATGFIWLKTQFPTRADLKAFEDRSALELKECEERITEKIEEHEDRLRTGSKAMADLDKRTALVEDECKSAPSRQNLQVELSSIAQRTRGVEEQVDGVKRELGTLNSYLHTLIERGLGGGSGR